MKKTISTILSLAFVLSAFGVVSTGAPAAAAINVYDCPGQAGATGSPLGWNVAIGRFNAWEHSNFNGAKQWTCGSDASMHYGSYTGAWVWGHQDIATPDMIVFSDKISSWKYRDRPGDGICSKVTVRFDFGWRGGYQFFTALKDGQQYEKSWVGSSFNDRFTSVKIEKVFNC